MNQIIKIAIAAVLAFFAGKYLFPLKPEVKEVIKTVTIEKVVERRNVVKNTKTTEKPDGTKVTETTESDKTVIVDNTSSKSEKTTQIKGSKLTLGLLYIKDGGNISAPANFGATITVPLLGNIKAQALGTTDRKIGVGLALEF